MYERQAPIGVIHDFIVSLLYRCGPDGLRFIMAGQADHEALPLYNSIPTSSSVITDAKKAILTKLSGSRNEQSTSWHPSAEAEAVRCLSIVPRECVAPP